jgi:alkanesulfonate monooxygenase SsuD/methylene tetrahydromethanopterin reductase-like flavin-dependent oxidoreductase (luciferase family)
VGAGWNREEMENHGTDPKRRFGVMRERVEAMKEIWTQDAASYHGRHADFDQIWAWPKPVQKPHPPVLVGGNGKRVLERVVAFGDEWLPNQFPGTDEFLGRVAELQERARAAGRDPIPVTLMGPPRDPEALERLAEAGVHRIVWWLPPESLDVIERKLDQRAEFASQAGLATV